MRRWFMWIPVLMVASLLFWTLALGLGGMSLRAAEELSILRGHGCPYQQQQEDSADRDSFAIHGGYDPIVVHIQESADPQDVGDNQGAGLTGAAAAPPSLVDDEQLAGRRPSEPGRTAF